MGDEKEGDIRVPLALTVFLLCEITGGIFLFFYVFLPNLSQPWHPTAALFLIGFPWLFWLIIYIYACKRLYCLQGGGGAVVDHQISRRQSFRNGSSTKEPELPLTQAV